FLLKGPASSAYALCIPAPAPIPYAASLLPSLFSDIPSLSPVPAALVTINFLLCEKIFLFYHASAKSSVLISNFCARNFRLSELFHFL
ncbi:hypothetical protein, partial [Eisenbergiella porci]